MLPPWVVQAIHCPNSQERKWSYCTSSRSVTLCVSGGHDLRLPWSLLAQIVLTLGGQREVDPLLYYLLLISFGRLDRNGPVQGPSLPSLPTSK